MGSVIVEYVDCDFNAKSRGVQGWRACKCPFLTEPGDMGFRDKKRRRSISFSRAGFVDSLPPASMGGRLVAEQNVRLLS